MNYYEHHLGDYAKDTGHLTMLEHGAYRILLDRYYSTEQGIPADQAYRLARARSEEECRAVDVILEEFFELVGGVWIQHRVEHEIGQARKRITAAQENGKKGGRPRKKPAGSNQETQQKPNGLPVGSDSETQEKAHHLPSTTSHLPEEHIGSKSTLSTPPPDSHEGDGERDDSSYGDPRPYGLIAKTLRDLGVNVGSSNPDFREWVDSGLSVGEASDGVEIARKAKPAPESIPWSYLAKVLATQRTAAVKPPPAKPARQDTAADNAEAKRLLLARRKTQEVIDV